MSRKVDSDWNLRPVCKLFHCPRPPTPPPSAGVIPRSEPVRLRSRPAVRRRRPLCFCEFEEAPRYQPADPSLKFYPTYKKRPARHALSPQDYTSSDWVKRHYNIDYT
jgi:hypothetical protein